MFRQLLKVMIAICFIFSILVSYTYIKRTNNKINILFESIDKIEVLVNDSYNIINNISKDINIRINEVNQEITIKVEKIKDTYTKLSEQVNKLIPIKKKK